MTTYYQHVNGKDMFPLVVEWSQRGFWTSVHHKSFCKIH